MKSCPTPGPDVQHARSNPPAPAHGAAINTECATTTSWCKNPHSTSHCTGGQTSCSRPSSAAFTALLPLPHTPHLCHHSCHNHFYATQLHLCACMCSRAARFPWPPNPTLNVRHPY